jgi:hypothetical protein
VSPPWSGTYVNITDLSRSSPLGSAKWAPRLLLAPSGYSIFFSRL